MILQKVQCVLTQMNQKLKIFQDGEWTYTDPFEDLEERKVKK